MTLIELGWTDFFNEAWNERADRKHHFPARVIEEQKNFWRLASDRGEFLAQLAGRFRYEASDQADLPSVGDWVAASEGTIHGVLPRRTKISRKAAGRRTDEQIIAANIDTVFVVTALNQEYKARRLERYLTLIWEGGAQPAVILNKADLCENIAAMVHETEIAAPGVPVHALSARNGAAVDELAPYLVEGCTVAFIGSSGVGKSTLINRLVGTERQSVKTVLEDGRGRHTTTARSLIALPAGALLIDTPGMREIQLWASEDSLESAFVEIEDLAVQCRFRDCRHETEPGCAVLQALSDGELPAERYESFLKLRGEIAYLERKQDVSAQIELKRKWTIIHKAHRQKKTF